MQPSLQTTRRSPSSIFHSNPARFCKTRHVVQTAQPLGGRSTLLPSRTRRRTGSAASTASSTAQRTTGSPRKSGWSLTGSRSSRSQISSYNPALHLTAARQRHQALKHTGVYLRSRTRKYCIAQSRWAQSPPDPGRTACCAHTDLQRYPLV